jgi:hypothetical protein
VKSSFSEIETLADRSPLRQVADRSPVVVECVEQRTPRRRFGPIVRHIIRCGWGSSARTIRKSLANRTRPPDWGFSFELSIRPKSDRPLPIALFSWPHTVRAISTSRENSPSARRQSDRASVASQLIGGKISPSAVRAQPLSVAGRISRHSVSPPRPLHHRVKRGLPCSRAAASAAAGPTWKMRASRLVPSIPIQGGYLRSSLNDVGVGRREQPIHIDMTVIAACHGSDVGRCVTAGNDNGPEPAFLPRRRGVRRMPRFEAARLE